MDLHGLIWIDMDLYGLIWIYMDLYVLVDYIYIYNMWIDMDSYGLIWIYMDLYRFIWIYMDLYGFIWIDMDLYGFIWIYMNLWIYPLVICYITIANGHVPWQTVTLPEGIGLDSSMILEFWETIVILYILIFM